MSGGAQLVWVVVVVVELLEVLELLVLYFGDCLSNVVLEIFLFFSVGVLFFSSADFVLGAIVSSEIVERELEELEPLRSCKSDHIGIKCVFDEENTCVTMSTWTLSGRPFFLTQLCNIFFVSHLDTTFICPS